MLTFPQWKNTRRVDHFNIPIVNRHPRLRSRDPNQQPDLKTFDQLVEKYDKPGTTELDRVVILGDILDQAAEFRAKNKDGPDRYLRAVERLQDAAIQDLKKKVPSERGNEIGRDIEAAAKGHTLSQKEIRINVYYLDQTGADPDLALMDAAINAQINTANTSQAFWKAGLEIKRNNSAATLISETAQQESILMTSPSGMAGRLWEKGTGGARLIKALRDRGGDGVDVVFLQKYHEDDIQGFTFQVSKEYAASPGRIISPARPIVTARTTPVQGGEKTYSTTLQHEICHAISGNGDHSPDRDNLMAEGHRRTGKNDLSLGQIGWYRNNGWVEDEQ